LALLYNAPRAATVTAKVDSSLWVIDRSDFKLILRQQAQKKLDVYNKLLSKVEMLSILLADERQALVECLVRIWIDDLKFRMMYTNVGENRIIICERFCEA
jgi:CRP-like cAMP-binding protein